MIVSLHLARITRDELDRLAALLDAAEHLPPAHIEWLCKQYDETWQRWRAVCHRC